MKILVADDDPVSLTALVGVLRKFGHDVVAVTNGTEAWNYLQQVDSPQIAVLDWMMPGLDGPEVCRRLRARTTPTILYLLLLTSKAEPEDIVLGLKAGADDFLTKPCNPAELRARLDVGYRVVQLCNDLNQNVRDLQTALVERRKTEERLRQSENHLRMVMNTVPAGVLVCDGITEQITNANPVAQASLGLSATELKGRKYRQFFQNSDGAELESLPPTAVGSDCRAVSAQGHASHVRLTQAAVRFEDRDLRILSFLDISDTRRLLAEQQLNLDQARKLLMTVNAGVPSWIGLNDELTLHLSPLSASSRDAGGDHCWARTLPAHSDRGPVTVVGVRDQSGHEVNCILRSIATDFFHKEALDQGLRLEEQIVYVNDRLCASGLFAGDDFLTGLTLELDHSTLQLRYIANGHPPMFLVRDNHVIALPDANHSGRSLPLGSLAGMTCEAGQQQLRAGDRLVLFTDGLLELRKLNRGTILSLEELQRIIETLVTESPEISVRQLIRSLLATITGVSTAGLPSAPPDDVTILGMEIEPDNGPHETVLRPASYRELDDAVLQLHQRLLKNWQMENLCAQRLRLFLDEALTNAWVHGNHENPLLPIRVRWGYRNSCSLTVEDSGKGFDPGHLLDPRTSAGLLQESGRGVFLMQNSCDWVAWKKNGTRLVARLGRTGA